MRKITLIFLCILPLLGFSAGTVNLLQDPRVDVLLRRSIESNRNVSVEGFRINIFSQPGPNSRANALAAQTLFFERFPDVRSYVSFDEPYFRVNVGNFRTRLEATAALDALGLRRLYPQAFVIRDALDAEHLLGLPLHEETYYYYEEGVNE